NNGAFNPADPDIRFSAREQAQTDTPAFKEWFGDSKIVKDGKPLVVYHGTGSSFDRFGNARGNAYYFTDDKEAAAVYAEYAGPSSDEEPTPAIVPVYLSVKNPLVLSYAWQLENMEADGEWDWEVLDKTLYQAEEE